MGDEVVVEVEMNRHENNEQFHWAQLYNWNKVVVEINHHENNDQTEKSVRPMLVPADRWRKCMRK